ncbi:calcineurin-like phosphoesterase domain-containing protein [Phthorimaea operculella]|nr:calcineurin-like phosphoesterase domain-containing protein [Phthorimaea operculella]
MVLHLLSLVWSAFVAPSDKCRTFDENCLPEQVHIAFGDKINDIAITWSTMKDTHKSVVQFGEKTTDQMTTGHRTVFVDGGALKHKQWIHRATLMDLKYDTKYVYKVGSKYGMSKEFSFRTPPSGQDFVLNALVVGDMGIPEGEKVKTLAGLEYELKNSRYYMVIHNGDFAYEFYDENGMKGDRFMRMIEPVAANIPYMTTPGNHEDRYNFSHYKNRFTMPRHGHENMFYSFNIGLVHFVMANTEVYHIDAPEQQEKYPWIILMAHQPMYCSSTNKWDKCRKLDGTDADYPQRVGIPEFGGKGMEVLLKDYGVDLVICAHEHFFERSWPLYNKTVNNGTQGAYINPG